MTIQNYIQDPAVLTAAATVQGAAVPSLTKRLIRAATICNPTAAPVAASVYFVPSGGAAGTDNVMISARTISPGESYPCPELVNHGLNAGGTVQALGNGLTFKHAATDIS